MIVKESYSVDASDPAFIHIHHTQVEDNGANMGGSTWFERGSLSWVVSTLQACLTTYGFPETTTQIGKDSLKVYESGPEQAPIINLRNRRPQDAPHGGLSGFMMSKPHAEKLVKELAALR